MLLRKRPATQPRGEKNRIETRKMAASRKPKLSRDGSIFRGTGVALVTPFTKGGHVDFKALAKLIDHVIEHGVDYLVALGTTAETPTLTADEKKEVLISVLRHADGRVPVVCGMGGNNTQEVLDCIDSYPLEGVAGLLSVAPYYNKPSQEGIFQHFKAIAKATSLPIILYNVPGRTVTNILPQTAIRIAKECDNVVAIKEASGNLVQCMELIASKPNDFVVLSGDDNLVVPQIAIGMEGVISVAANCFTREFTSMVNAALRGDFNEARELHYKLLPGIDLLFAEGNPAGVKYVLYKMGLVKNSLRLPLVPVSSALAEKIDSILD
jgi:4-hydroxy-tetrahydrodipicolinate synthase